MQKRSRDALSALRRLNILPALWPALLGWLLAVGLTLPALRALSLDAAGDALVACSFCALVCALSGLPRRGQWAVWTAGGVLALVWLFLSGAASRVGGMLGAAIHLFSGNVEPVRVYAPEVGAALGALLALICWAMARQSAGLYPALSLTMAVFLLVWISGGDTPLWLFAPALVALCAMLAGAGEEGVARGRALAVSAVAVVLAVSLTPLLSFTSPTLAHFADRLRTYITDTLFFTEPREVYSLQVDGYQPLETRLGGPANVQERPVMTVHTPVTLLLRGSIQNDYNGLAWNDTLSMRRYLYGDPRHAAVRARTLDEELPLESLRQHELFAPVEARVTMQSGSASTLFLPLRVQTLSMPMSMVPYFNASSELFITRNLEAGDEYAFAAPVISPDDARLPALLEQAAAQAEVRDMSNFLGVPQAIAEDVRTITREVTASCSTPLEKALAIRDYLRETYAYSLTPDVPPDNQDFVSYFLLREKKGYCTYFASAMAVMGRIAGLPTRYIEGYLARPVDGVALVTSKSAHAWAEVYFDGFGWVAFDATPAEGIGGNGDSPQTPPDGGNDGDSSQDSPENEPESTPENSPQDSPENAQQPVDNQQPQSDEGDAPQNMAQAQPSPSPTPAPPDENAPQDEPEPPAVPKDDKNSLWWLWLLLALLLAALIALRVWQTMPETVEKRAADEDERLLVWYRALLGLLAAAGMGAKSSESPTTHALRLDKAVPEEANLLEVADAVTLLGYGRYGASPAQTQAAKDCYRTLLRALPVRARALWTLKRIWRGIGSVRQVP